MGTEIARTETMLDDVDLAARLRPSFPTLAGSLGSDEAFGFVTPQEARRALDEIVEYQCAPAEADTLTYALAWLATVTTGEKLRDPATMQASARALVKAMLDYPEHAAIGAIKDWPQTEGGKWWPTENELRLEAGKRATERLRLRAYLRSQAERAPPQQRSMQPQGKTLRFTQAVERIKGSSFVRAWLSHRTCEFTWTTIFTTATGVERLQKECGNLLEGHGVEAAVCRDVTQRFYEERDMLDADAPKKRRGGA